MQALRGTISGAAAACVAVSAALVLASAPAASSHQDGRLLVTSAAARRYTGVVERTTVTWPRRAAMSVGNVTVKGAMLAVRPTSLATASNGRMRVVIETSNPALARESVRALGGQVERSAAGLVQALVKRQDATVLAGKPGVDRVRPPYAQIQRASRRHAGSGVAGEGVYRQGRQGGRDRRRLQGPRRATGVGRPPRECRHAGLLRRPATRGRGSRHCRRGDRP